MPVFDTLWELRKGKLYKTAISTRMSKNHISENNPIMETHENNTDNEFGDTHPNSGRS